MRSAIDIKATTYICGVANFFVKIFFTIIFVVGTTHLLKSQNLIYNSGFEESSSNYVTYVGYHPIINKYYRIDSFTTHWSDFYHDKVYSKYHHSIKDTIFNGLVEEKLPKPFLGNAYMWVRYSYLIYDTIKNILDTSGNKPTIGSYVLDGKTYYKFRGYNGEHSSFFQKFKQSLIKDSSYVLSYRQKYGSEVYNKNLFYYNANGDYFTNINKHGNIMSGFGILFTTTNISGKGQINVYQEKYSDIIKSEFQDTILDTSYNWRLIEREFNADSNYNYLAFGQFLNNKFNIKYKAIYPNYIIANLSEIQKTYYFPYFIDDVRLLPKWQYLKVTSDVYACEGDSVELRVLDGAGGYQWAETNNPSIILSTSESLIVKLVDTNIKYQVMSPYDTAIIPIYVAKNTSTYDTINYSSCENKPLKISNPNILRWYDNTKDTFKTFTTTGNYWYETKTNCDVKKTQMNIKIDISKYDTIRQTSCDSFTYKNTSYKNSGFYTFPYKSIYGCDSMQTLALTIHKSYYQGSEINSCKPYQWLDSIYTQSGKYHKIMKTLHQCDSIIELDLNIGLDRRVRLENGIHYTALQDSVRYEWYRCNPWRRITNETKQTFTTKTRGSYAVVLDNGKGCRDTSDCLELYSSALINPAQAGVSMWSVFPNPFSDELIIDLGKDYKEVSVKIYDLTGRLISNQVVKNHSTLKINNSKLPSGVYYLQIETESQNQFFNIRKE